MAHGTGFARGLFAASLIVFTACGGVARSSSNDNSTSNAGASGSMAGGEPEVPRLNGIPIGDCREPTDDERAALGCPKSPPTDGAPCSLPGDVTCAYSLSTNQTTARQDLYMCSNDAERHWWLLQEQCGGACTNGGPPVLELDVADCATREEDSCWREGVVYAYAPSGYTLTSEMLRNVIWACAPGTGDFVVSLELARGCAKRFSTSHDFSPGELACIRERLEGVRYVCGEKVPCAYYAEFFL